MKAERLDGVVDWTYGAAVVAVLGLSFGLVSLAWCARQVAFWLEWLGEALFQLYCDDTEL